MPAIASADENANNGRAEPHRPVDKPEPESEPEMNHPDSARQNIVGTGRQFTARMQPKFTSTRTAASRENGNPVADAAMPRLGTGDCCMADIPTLVTFHSPAFNTSTRRDYFINDCCYGDDLAGALIERLRAHGVQTDAEPGQEDFGWYFGFGAGDAEYQFVVAYRPADENAPAIWIGWLERKAGFIGSLFGARRRGIDPDAARLIHSAISALPQVSNIRWHQKHDFDAGREELARNDPAG
jgi:hypothetical protein